jgi:polysaccharide chain length determinant protein (PEP-CTERM system associated)
MQPTQDSYSTPRRALDFEDYLDIFRRHVSWIFAPLLAGLVISVVVAFLWPDTYVSSAVIRVLPATIPERFVPTNVNVELSQRINSMAQKIMSRATLTNIIQTFALYPKELRRLPMEDIIEEMRLKDIRIGQVLNLNPNVARAGGAFSISFRYENRHTAQKVCQDLVRRFIDENTRESFTQSEMTTSFLKDQVDQAKANLDNIEQQLTQFRLQNLGKLPEERQLNLSALGSLEARLTALNQNVSRINQDKLVAEAELRRLADMLKEASTAQLPSPAVVQARNERLVQFEREIEQGENSLAMLKQQYSENHPDVIRLQTNLATLKKQRDNLERQEQDAAKKAPQPAVAKAPARPAREVKELELAVGRLQTQIQAKDTELEEVNRQIVLVDKQIKGITDRIESSPLGEQRYAQLLREYEQAKTVYTDLSAKRVLSERATKLEDRKQGETLEMLDPASLPQSPTEPNRWLIIGIGTGIGLLLGMSLTGIREFKDTTLKNLKDVRAYTQLTVLGSIPLLENDVLVRRRRRMAWLAWSTACLVSAVVVSGSIYYYYSTKL